MKPTKAPGGMGEEYGMYDNYADYGDDYDDEDFFYHMYFDEVSTTPIPEEFYDLLESVSNSDSDYFGVNDYFGGYDYGLRFRNSSETTTQASSRRSKNTKYLNLFSDKSSQRRNSKYLRAVKSDVSMRDGSVRRSLNDSKRDKSVKLRSKRSMKNKKKSAKGKKLKAGFRKRKQISPGVIGILDRRIPLFFRQSPFVTIALTKFVILSTGVTTGNIKHYFSILKT